MGGLPLPLPPPVLKGVPDEGVSSSAGMYLKRVKKRQREREGMRGEAGG